MLLIASRIATAVVILPVLVLSIWVSSLERDQAFWSPLLWLSVPTALIAAAGALEICQMTGRRGVYVASQVSVGWTVAIVGGAHFIASGYSIQETAPVVVAILAIIFGTWLPHRPKGGIGLLGWCVTLGASLYPGGLLSYALFLRVLNHGREWLLTVVFCTFASDSTAFFVGRRFGRIPLARKISPGKTWEGWVGGIFGGMASLSSLGFLFGLDLSWSHVLVLGILMGVVGQLGDLLESGLKRLAQVKDSGTIVPGHGGVLDRVDSIVFNLVLVYHFVVWSVR